MVSLSNHHGEHFGEALDRLVKITVHGEPFGIAQGRLVEPSS